MDADAHLNIAARSDDVRAQNAGKIARDERA